MVSLATCLNKNDGVKMAKRWCWGSKTSKYQKPCLGKNLLLKNSKFILITFFNKSIPLWCSNVVPDGADFFIAMKIKNMNIDCICDWLITIRWLTVSLNYLMSFLWPIKILRLRLYQKSKQPVDFTFCHKSMFNKQLVRAPTWIYSINNYLVKKKRMFWKFSWQIWTIQGYYNRGWFKP